VQLAVTSGLSAIMYRLDYVRTSDVGSWSSSPQISLTHGLGRQDGLEEDQQMTTKATQNVKTGPECSARN